MKYRIIFQPRALQNLEDQYQHIAKHNARAAANWFNMFVAALEGLSEMPERCAVARESELVGKEIRQFLFGKRAGTIAHRSLARGSAGHVPDAARGRGAVVRRPARNGSARKETGILPGVNQRSSDASPGPEREAISDSPGGRFGTTCEAMTPFSPISNEFASCQRHLNRLPAPRLTSRIALVVIQASRQAVFPATDVRATMAGSMSNANSVPRMRCATGMLNVPNPQSISATSRSPELMPNASRTNGTSSRDSQ
jgi:plasmid stabilization system protein ParE